MLKTWRHRLEVDCLSTAGTNRLLEMLGPSRSDDPYAWSRQCAAVLHSIVITFFRLLNRRLAENFGRRWNVPRQNSNVTSLRIESNGFSLGYAERKRQPTIAKSLLRRFSDQGGGSLFRGRFGGLIESISYLFEQLRLAGGGCSPERTRLCVNSR